MKCTRVRLGDRFEGAKLCVLRIQLSVTGAGIFLDFIWVQVLHRLHFAAALVA